MNFIDEQLLQLKHSDPNFVAPNLQNVIPQVDNSPFTDNGNWLEAAGIGASNMLNNLGLGGVAQVLGNLGAGVEYISPFSGSRDSDRARLESWGVPPEIARQAYPDEDSWLTSGAKGLLEAQNFIADKIKAWRDEAIGDNPSYGTNVAEGVGSSGGFMLGGTLATIASGGNPIVGAIISGVTEALSESGGTLGDAYRQGLYDNGGLAAANKSFLSNAALNSGLNLMGGMFSPWMSNIRNPLTRYAAQTAGEVLNELVQEPSQQVIEKSALESLGNGGNFTSALWQNIPEWWDTAKQLAPTVSASSLITSLLKTGYDMSSAQNRQIVRDQWRNRMYDPQKTADSLKSELDARQRLLNQLQREKNTVNDEAKIAAINDSIAKAERRIAMYQDRLKPGNLDYTPNPYDEFSGKVSPVSTIAGQNTYNTAFKLMEADDITTSHNDDFSVNPNFPQERQIRNRSNSVSQQEVERIAATLDPNALGDNYLAQNGAPIIAEDNSDLSGNGRVLAIRRAYSHHPEQAKKYRQFIIDNAANFGVDPDLAARMKKPVLVRVLLGDNDLAKFATEANSNTIQQLSAGEQAIKDLDIINKSGIMQKFDPLKPLAQQTEVLKDFAAGLQPNERNNFFTDAGQGGISNAGLQRVQDAISAYAYGNSEIIGKLSEAANDISRNVSNALKSLAGRFAHLKATNRGHLDISNDIAQAIQHLDRFRRNKSKSVSEQAAQQNLSGNGQNIDEQLNLSPEAELLLRFFDQFGNQPNTILQGLANYAQLASSQAEDGQQTFDPDLKRDKLSILREALGDKTAAVQQTTPTTANSLTTATQTQQITPNVTALNDTQQDNSSPQGARLVENSQVNTSDEQRKQAKSIPDYSDDTDPTNLRPVPLQQNRQPYNNIDTIGLNDWQYQDNSDFDTPLIADISTLQQEYANEQQTQKTLGNLPNLNDNQGRGNLGSDIGNRSQVTSQRNQADISSEQNNDDNSQFNVPQFADISDIRQSEMNNDENSYAAAIPLNNRLNSQHDDNIQSLPVQQSNNTPDSAHVQNQQDSDYMKDYIDPEVIRTKDGDIHTPGAFVRRSYIPSEQAQIKNAAQTGKPMKRYVFVGRGENDTSAPTRNSPETYSYDARYSGQNGYIGDILTGAGDNSAAAHAFYGTQDGVHYVGFADDNGNFVATYNMNDNSFFINQGS
ncbi:MAG: hypothetical protein II877_04715, partial [Synergistaceae bacterium]|nr:hypothetical protein [Synergistaceae bacterium]